MLCLNFHHQTMLQNNTIPHKQTEEQFFSHSQTNQRMTGPSMDSKIKLKKCNINYRSQLSCRLGCPKNVFMLCQECSRLHKLCIHFICPINVPFSFVFTVCIFPAPNPSPISHGLFKNHISVFSSVYTVQLLSLLVSLPYK